MWIFVRPCRRVLAALVGLAPITVAPAVEAQTWTVAVTLLEAKSISDDDADGPDDLYWKARLAPTVGAGVASSCNFFNRHVDDDNEIEPNWTCTATVSGGPNTTVQIVMELWDHDTTSGDDHFDTNPGPADGNLVIDFRPADFHMTMNVAGWGTPRCAPGRIVQRGYDGDDYGELVFSLSASLAGAPNGDSDGDGLPDSWEVCGLDTDSDTVADVDLPAMGAKPERKDLFVEIDWMVNNTGVPATQHSHEPWLPALITAWEELNALRVTNPPPGRSGVALHLDVGGLYAGYTMDLDGNGTVDLQAGPGGDLDLDSPPDGIPDIGNLGALVQVGNGTAGGGNILLEDPLLTTTGADQFNAGSEFLAIKTNNFNPVRNRVFHYAVFGHQYGTATNTSSGLAENCAQAECDDFMVTLGTWARQRVDANRDGVPDTTGAFLTGPSGLQVDGLIRHHAGTFLHELGHNLALQHGGADAINYKPNFLSIMSYSWQNLGLAFDFTGDRIADPIGRDFDRDGLVDLRSFTYSWPPLPMLEERLNPTAGLNGLNEPVGISDQNTLTRYSCPLPPGATPPPANRIARGTGPIDWNCNGNAAGTAVQADINFRDGSGLTSLAGFDDHARVANGGLDFNFGLTKEEEREVLDTTQRIVPLGREDLVRCRAPKTITFEELEPGTKVDTQFAPLATFLLDAQRTPVTIDDAGRNGAPTQSPPNSLVNELPTGAFAPLVIEFEEPQQAITLSVGRTRSGEPTDDMEVTAVLQAFDMDGLSMGTTEVPLPSNAVAVTNLLSAAAVFPDQPIGRIELRYEISYVFGAGSVAVPIPEPQQIDDLIVCGELDSGLVQPSLPPPPKFGDLPATLTVNAVLVTAAGGAGDTEPDHVKLVEAALTGLPIQVDGQPATTDLALTRPEGTVVNLSAPAMFGSGATFDSWRYDDTVSFGAGKADIAVTLLRDGKATAVYVRGEGRQPRERVPRSDESRSLCECLERCCSREELR